MAGFVLAALLVLAWLVFAMGMQRPRHLKSFILHYRSELDARVLQSELCLINGVIDVMLIEKSHQAYLKIDEKVFTESSLRTYQAQL